MAGTTAAAGVRSSRDFRHCSESVLLNLAFDRPFGNKKAGADQRFVACPIIARGVAVFADRSHERFAGEPGTVFVIWYVPD